VNRHEKKKMDFEMIPMRRRDHNTNEKIRWKFHNTNEKADRNGFNNLNSFDINVNKTDKKNIKKCKTKKMRWRFHNTYGKTDKNGANNLNINYINANKT